MRKVLPAISTLHSSAVTLTFNHLTPKAYCCCLKFNIPVLTICLY